MVVAERNNRNVVVVVEEGNNRNVVVVVERNNRNVVAVVVMNRFPAHFIRELFIEFYCPFATPPKNC